MAPARRISASAWRIACIAESRVLLGKITMPEPSSRSRSYGYRDGLPASAQSSSSGFPGSSPATASISSSFAAAPTKS